MPNVLRLEVREFTDLTRWRWTLTDGGGAFLADHEVCINTEDWQFEAFTDLRRYVSWQAAPDRRLADEARIVISLGDWVGSEIFGGAVGRKLIEHRPATVQVIIPPDAEALAYLPLETARVQGRSLAGHDIMLVMQPGSFHTPAKTAVTERLRILALFSLPEGGNPLSLRRERHALVNVIRGIAAGGRAVDVRVLQYGVTRESLQDVIEEAEGWDIIHVSGHGTPGELVFETDTGAPDRITAKELAHMLDTARERVKLVTLAACWSAALSAAEQRHLLNLPVSDDQPHSAERPGISPHAPGALATQLADRLGCAVFAMRFPVDDEFAIVLSAKLYDLLARQGQPLPRATALTLKHLAGGAGGRRFPEMSMAAPAIFGQAAAELALSAPRRPAAPSFRQDDLKMAGFPPQPERFVGRTAVMTRASAALAAESGISGVLLHGMPGGGKTACALELAYTHEDAFEGLIWFKAPDEGMAIDGALTDFALTMERSVDGLPMIGTLADESKLDAFLPMLTEFMERTRLLIVIDNAESLVADSGQWRDERWGRVLGALTGHRGYGRVIVTSRRVPAEAPPGPRAEAVDALSADEALLLARELPNLRALIHGELPGIDRKTSRKLALGVLNIAQGHPKLLELADGQAADPGRLAALTEAGGQAWQEQGRLPDGFFRTGETPAVPADYLGVLAAWTKTVTDTLSPGERDLFRFLCCLEEPDRIRPVLTAAWAALWQRLGRDGQPLALERGLASISGRALAAVPAASGNENESYALHPAVAAAGRDHAGPGFQAAVDTEAAAYWHAVYRQARGQYGGFDQDTGLVVRAGLSAVPYLTRRQRWEDAAYMLLRAFVREKSRANAAAMLPAIQQITRHDPRQAIVLAQVSRVLDPGAAEKQLHALLEVAIARGDYRTAFLAAEQLISHCLDGGRLTEALTLAYQKAEYARQAGLGAWTQLADEVQRLQILNATGHADQVLANVQRLRGHMESLPVTGGPDDPVPPWEVRELLFDSGRAAALRLSRWEDALDLNAAQIASKRARQATAADIARARFNDYGPLLRLGRADEALELLLNGRQTFQDDRDIEMLGKTLGALASTENQRGHGDAAVRFERDALRYEYLAEDVAGIAASYHNLGTYLAVHYRQPAAALADYLIAALIRALTGIGGNGPGGTVESVLAVVIVLRQFGAAAGHPADVSDLCRRVGDIPGTDPARLIAQLSPDPETAEQTLQSLIAQARELAKPPA